METEKIEAVVEVGIDDSEAIEQAYSTQKTLEQILKDLKIGIDLGDKESMETGLGRIIKEMGFLQKYYDLSGEGDKVDRFNQLADAADMLRNRLKDLRQAADEVEDIDDDVGEIDVKVNAVQKTTVMIGKDLSNAVNMVKRFTLSLIGVQGLYGSIRKAMSVWLAQNDELQNKLNACWYALGSLFAPLLEWLINKFIYFVSIVDGLAKALGFAGINMSKYGKAAANASKVTAGFDEINNLSKGNGKSNPFADIDLGDKFGGLFSLIKANAEMLKLFGIGAMFGIGVALLFTGHVGTGLGMILASGILAYKELSENWDYIVSKVGGVGNALTILAGGFVFGLGTVLLFTGHIGLGLAMMVAGLSVAALTIDWSMLPAKIQETMARILAIAAASIFTIGLIVTFFNPVLGISMMLAGGLLGFAGAKLFSENALDDFAKSSLNTTDNTVYEGMSAIEATMDTGFGNMEYDMNDFSKSFTDAFGNMNKDIKKDNLSTWLTVVADVLKKIAELKQKMSDKMNEIKNWFKNISIGPFKIKMPHFVQTGTGLFGLPTFGIQWYANGGVFSGPSIIGVGEYPGASNNPEVVAPLSELQGMTGNEETNDLLRELISVVDSKEFKAYISQREVGEASVKYINQQSRIMGGSIV